MRAENSSVVARRDTLYFGVSVCRRNAEAIDVLPLVVPEQVLAFLSLSLAIVTTRSSPVALLD